MSAAEQRLVVIGGGPAAHSAVDAYRDAGGRGAVTILTAEPELPYERPPLTKEFLRGELAREQLPIAPGEWYRERRIEVVRSAACTELDLERGLASAADGRGWSFDRCLLATGADPVVPEVPGADRPGVQTIRTIPDSERLAHLGGSRALVVGSGFIGCEAAASLAMRGAEVAIAGLEPSPQVERLGAEVSASLAGWLRGYGVELIGEAELEAIEERGKGGDGLKARFADGREHAADAVLLALGIARNDSLASVAGVETDGGVLVDASMVSSDPRLLAAGDVALAQNTAARRRLRVEHWGEALNQGEVAGRTLAGERASWGAAPGFWSTIGERTVKYAGWGDGWDEVRLERHGDGFTAWYGGEGELVGVLTHQRDEDYEGGRERIEERAPWS
jgi:3-phenylpropionate/trans-cinnamate dioxygenase ferredoxin reductase component